MSIPLKKWIDLQLQRETNTTSNNTGLSGLIKNYNGVGKIIVPAVKNQFKQGWEDTKKRSRERSEQDKKILYSNIEYTGLIKN